MMFRRAVELLRSDGHGLNLHVDRERAKFATDGFWIRYIR